MRSSQNTSEYNAYEVHIWVRKKQQQPIAFFLFHYFIYVMLAFEVTAEFWLLRNSFLPRRHGTNQMANTYFLNETLHFLHSLCECIWNRICGRLCIYRVLIQSTTKQWIHSTLPRVNHLKWAQTVWLFFSSTYYIHNKIKTVENVLNHRYKKDGNQFENLI